MRRRYIVVLDLDGYQEDLEELNRASIINDKVKGLFNEIRYLPKVVVYLSFEEAQEDYHVGLGAWWKEPHHA